MRKLIKSILSEVGVEDLKIRSRGDNRCESANTLRGILESPESLHRVGKIIRYADSTLGLERSHRVDLLPSPGATSSNFLFIATREPCMTGGLVPGTREIRGGSAWPSAILFSMVTAHCSPILIAFVSFDPPSHSFCSCRLDRRELAGFGAVLVTLPVALMPPGASSVRLIGGGEVH